MEKLGQDWAVQSSHTEASFSITLAVTPSGVL